MPFKVGVAIACEAYRGNQPPSWHSGAETTYQRSVDMFAVVYGDCLKVLQV